MGRDLHSAQRVASQLDVLQEPAKGGRVERQSDHAGVRVVPQRTQDDTSAQLVHQVLPCQLLHVAFGILQYNTPP